MIQLRVWRWNDYLRYPSGFSIITEVLLRERGRQEGDREEDVTREAEVRGMQRKDHKLRNSRLPPKGKRNKETILLCRFQKESSPAYTLI